MARKGSKWLYLVAALAAVLSFAGGTRYGPALVEWLRGDANGGDQPGEQPGDLPLLPGVPDNEETRYLAEMVRQAAVEHRAEPVNAVYNSSYNIVLPGVNGYEMDQEATLARLAAAKPGEAVVPVWRQLKAAVTADHFPTAVIERGFPERRQVTLMINVAWGNEYLPEMLDILDQFGVKTTFFPVGRWAERYPELLREISERGHELGNHGYSDAELFPDLDYDAAADSIRRTNEIVAGISGQTPRWFTPHQGEYNQAALEAAADLGMRLLLWTLDTVDWQRPGEEVMARRILDHLVPGAIILMHPTEQSAGFLRMVLPEIEQRGYAVVTMSELLSPAADPPEIYLER
ncbi:MAG TPA: polysaccharide deacetylase family protein [Bacillota bacterium]|nr:polysaccharide deacetylase family protein [Bacillota bacterium]